MKAKPTPPTKTMKDATGQDIPVKFIPKIDLDADKKVKKILAAGKALQQKLIDYKNECLELCDGWYSQLLSELKSKEKDTDNKKGNYTLFSFDRSIKVTVRIGTRIEFDSKIDIAKLKIDEYLQEITKGSNDEIKLIVNQAFTTTRGQLDSKRVLNLFTLQITHKLWKEAMELLKASIKTNITKRYMEIAERDENGEYQTLVLQFSNL